MEVDAHTTLLICPMTADTIEAMRADMLRAASAGADAVECRLDYLAGDGHVLPTDDELAYLLVEPPCPVVATCRPASQGGRYAGPESPRLVVLKKAGAFDRVAAVDIELDTHPMFRPACRAQRILSYHDFHRCPHNLSAVVDQLEAAVEPINKVVVTANGPEDALRVLDELRRCSKPTIALAMGDAGVASRILARKLGAWGTFAALEGGLESAPGQTTIRQMRTLYRWEHIGASTDVFGVIGCPIAHSMSPAIHNAAFGATGVDGVYLPLRVEPGAGNFDRLLRAIRRRPWLDVRGLSVTLPHKEAAFAWVGESNCDELACKIGAINTIRIDADGRTTGCNTDYAGALDALCEAMAIGRDALAGRGVAVLGAGGVARALVAALSYYGCDVTVYNRTLERARRLAGEFGCRAASLGEAETTDAEILINCTSVGMHPNVDESPLDRIPSASRIVFDTIYNPVRTRLLQLAEDAGRRTIDGVAMFVNQAVAQFDFWLADRDVSAPRNVMEQVVRETLARR
ncbi:MAG: shikimate dehydrogenase [Planctomycetes bacterium]|jgi:3-dehydroquinate dehydratase/shikimate dehydrogenase|nr:shikimate dehydrogenase [Planctomycetota bacterium]